jgi:uncharacterized damage-inducible protein DinB
MAFALLSIRRMENPRITEDGTPQIDPAEWKTGDEPMTAAQSSYLETLCRETGEEFDSSLTKAQASERIDALRAKSPRLSQD